eukprot:1990831-Pyramimonas_sp.AAC.1
MAATAGWDSSTTESVKKIPLLTTKAGPRDGEEWTKRLKEEYKVRRSGLLSTMVLKGRRDASARAELCASPKT